MTTAGGEAGEGFAAGGHQDKHNQHRNVHNRNTQGKKAQPSR
jgi:hypothetical protein